MGIFKNILGFFSKSAAPPPRPAPTVQELRAKWAPVTDSTPRANQAVESIVLTQDIPATVTETPAPAGEKEKRYAKAKAAGVTTVTVDATEPTSNIAKLAKKPRKTAKRS